MKSMMIAACVALAATTLSAVPRSQLSPEEREVRRQKAKERFYQETGGRLLDTRKMKGRVVYVNAQDSAKEEWLKESADYFNKAVKVKVDVENGVFSFPEVKKVGEITIFVIENPLYPSILAAPDQGWAAVNVAPLKQGNGEKPQFFKARVRKELTRAFTVAAGGIESAYEGNVVGPIVDVADLDKYADDILPKDVLKRFVKQMERRGITPYKNSTYIEACMEGWGHSPTNDVEKKIWDYVHKLPENPLPLVKPTK